MKFSKVQEEQNYLLMKLFYLFPFEDLSDKVSPPTVARKKWICGKVCSNKNEQNLSLLKIRASQGLAPGNHGPKTLLIFRFHVGAHRQAQAE